MATNKSGILYHAARALMAVISAADKSLVIGHRVACLGVVLLFPSKPIDDARFISSRQGGTSA